MWRSDGGNNHVIQVVAEYQPFTNTFTYTNGSTNLLQDLKVGPNAAALRNFTHSQTRMQCFKNVFTETMQTIEAENTISVCMYKKQNSGKIQNIWYKKYNTK